jgi:hypothetical protein
MVGELGTGQDSYIRRIESRSLPPFPSGRRRGSLLSWPARMPSSAGRFRRLPRRRSLADVVSIIVIGFQQRHGVVHPALAVRNGQSRDQLGLHLLQVRRLIRVGILHGCDGNRHSC